LGGLRLNNNNLHVGFPVVIPYLPYKLVFGDPLHIPYKLVFGDPLHIPYKLVFGDPLHIPYKLVFDYIVVLLTFLIGLLLLSHIF
jgi:hypothetical protein